MPKLDDEFCEVSLPGCDPSILQGLIEFDLLGGHRLDLHHLVRALGAGEVDHDLVRLFGVPGPVDGDASLRHGLLRLDEILVQMPPKAVLDLLAGDPQFLPIAHLGGADGALATDDGGGVPQVLAELLILQGTLRGLGKSRHPEIGTLRRGRGQAFARDGHAFASSVWARISAR